MGALWVWVAWLALIIVTVATAIAIYRGRPKPGEYAWFFGAFVPYPKDSEPDNFVDKSRPDIAETIEQQRTEPPRKRTIS